MKAQWVHEVRLAPWDCDSVFSHGIAVGFEHDGILRRHAVQWLSTSEHLNQEMENKAKLKLRQWALDKFKVELE